MTRRLVVLVAVSLTCVASAGPARAQNCGDPPDMLILLDRSGSMSLNNKWSDSKTAINNMLTNYASSIRFGLLLFPTSGRCNVKLPPNVTVGLNNQSAIMTELNSSTPSGVSTPLSGALYAADVYLTNIDPTKTKYVMVITDGSETCTTTSPSTYVKRLYGDKIKTYVVGFGSDVDATELNKMAVEGGTALSGTTKYYQANNLTQLSSALSKIAATATCCGNGTLDSGEKCDTGITTGTGACPTKSSCDDSKACTKDTISGTGCQAVCTHTTITTAINGDGCCPSGATSLTDSDCAAVCGNGVVESGETCDTKITSGTGTCPTLSDCNDSDVCTKDTLSGSNCTAKCVHTALKASTSSKDGCCPSGATSLTDSDCSPVCGNGVVESGETCDTKITSGSGTCPTLSDCDDSKVCTKDSLSGSNCTAKCVHTALKPSTSSKDGCCPSGATSLTDADCSPVCGNGVVESGETCDTKITSGSGTCDTLSDCNDSDVCTKDALSGSGCTVKCTNTKLTANATTKDGCCPSGATSLTDADCAPTCGNGKLDSGELCDPKISSGIGACPTLASCNDNKVCTKDALSGSACTLKCTHTALKPSTSAKDGCCPSGATSLTDSDCATVCGNGVVESGETCDTKITSGTGKCDTLSDCNDSDVCTKDALSGSSCTVKCTNTALKASTSSKDGCCPTGATSLTDSDCKPGCGNGLLESGEKCDPGISSGKGACPTLSDCDDKDKCTKDALGGGKCTLACTHTKLQADATKTDGCCPQGANAITDRDCKASCGNGALETGENCDTKITSGPGSCPSASDCDDNDKCTTDKLVGTNCLAKCENTAIAAKLSEKDGCCPDGHSSKTDPDCLPPCGPDRTTHCVDLCKGVSCKAGQFCKDGKCVAFPDAGPGLIGDGGTSNDAGFGDANGIPGDAWFGDPNSGCDCRTGGSTAPDPSIVLALLALVLIRRRSRGG